VGDSNEKSFCQQRELSVEADAHTNKENCKNSLNNDATIPSNEMLYEQMKLLQERIALLERRAGVFAGQFDLVNTSITNIVRTVNMLHKNLYKEISESLIAVVHEVLGS